MQFKKIGLLVVSLVLMLGFSSAWAAKTYSEDEFLNQFSGKSAKVVTETLGKPERKDQSVKPSNADSMVAKAGQGAQEDRSKPTNVEMWYYSNIVTYAPKKTYKVIELTMVNGRCMNIAFFNN